MKTWIGLGLAISLLLGADAIKGEESLQGTWSLCAGEADGKTLSEEQLQDGKLVIQGDRYSVTLGDSEPVTGVQKLAQTEGTMTIDITDVDGPRKGQTCLGIYELKGDEFRVAFAQPGKARPSNFSTKPDSGCWVHTWKRVAE